MKRPGGVYRSMDERDWLAQRFQAHRPGLRAVAYRMLGSTSEADDAVQEAWIRLSRSNAGEIDNLEAWLVDAAAPREVVAAFLAAARDGDFDGLVAVLDPDMVLHEDTGSGTLLEVRGADNVARRAMAFSRLGLDVRPALVNG